MIRKAETVHLWSPDDVRKILHAALLTTEEMDVPEDLRPAFFTAAVALTSAAQHQFEQVGVNNLGLIVGGGR